MSFHIPLRCLIISHFFLLCQRIVSKLIILKIQNIFELSVFLPKMFLFICYIHQKRLLFKDYFTIEQKQLFLSNFYLFIN